MTKAYIDDGYIAADGRAFLDAITRACNSLIEAEPQLTEQDRIAGDGDAGLTLEAGAKALLKAISEGTLAGKNIIEDVNVIAEVVEEDMGGTSGALYSLVLPSALIFDTVREREIVLIGFGCRIFFAGLGKALRDAAVKGEKTTTPQVWSTAATEALSILYKCVFLKLSLVDCLDIPYHLF